MLSLRRSLPIALSLLLTLFVVACGSFSNSGTTNSGMNSGMNSSSTSTSSMAGSTPTTAPMKDQMTPMPTAHPSTTIHTTQVMLNGKMVTVLTTASGMMLYYRLSDPVPESTCTGGCAMTWPPLILNSVMPTSSVMLPHKLTVYMTANGNQVEYDGHPVYTYSGDMAPGQFNGRGMGNVWYLVGVNL